MLLQIRVSGVRNLAAQELALGPGITLITGANAQGKSSLLEAVYTLATTRSFKTRDPREMIAENAQYMRVSGRAQHRGQDPFELGISLGRGRSERHLTVGESTPKLVDYLGLLPVLFQAGESVRMIVGSPAERRRFMDRVTAAADPTHLADLTRYTGALTQRNRLLRSNAPDRELEPWEQILRSVGRAVVRRRREQLAAWQQWLGAWPDLFPEGQDARLIYKPAPEPGTRPEITANEAATNEAATNDTRTVDPGDDPERVRRIRLVERKAGVTLTGPHRDDLLVAIAGRDLLRYGSAGQIRAAFSALTLSQAKVVQERRPRLDLLLLLDDLDSDLDARRCLALLDHAASLGQVLAATSKPEIVPRDFTAVWRMQSGVATPADLPRA